MRIMMACIVLGLAMTTPLGAAGPASAVEPPEETPRIICFGDSITAGKYPEFLATRVSGYQVLNAGVGGNTTGQGLARMEEDVLRHRPEVVLILFGTNDSVLRAPGAYRTPLEMFQKNLETMLARCRGAGARPILGTLLPIMAEPYYTRHPKEYYTPEGGLEAILERYRQATMAVGKKHKAPVVDFYTKISGDLTMLKRDGVHPNEAGLKEIARLFGEAVKKSGEPETAPEE